MKYYIYWDEARDVVLNQFRKQLFVMNEPRYK